MLPGHECRSSWSSADSEISAGACGSCRRSSPVMRSMSDDEILARARAQRRQHHGQHAEAIVEILAKAPRLHLLHQVATGRDDHAHVHGHVLHAARAAKLLRLEQAKELPLHRQLEGRDLVEQQRALVRNLRQPEAPCGRVPRAAQLVAEELRIERALERTRTRDLDERLVRAIAHRVHRVRHLALRGALLAEQKHGRAIARGEQLDLVRELAHGRRRAEQRADALDPAPLAHEVRELPQPRLLESALRRDSQVIEVDRLREKILRSALQRLHRERECLRARSP